jgi:hypothetical protein
MEEVAKIPKLAEQLDSDKHTDRMPHDTLMAINCEYGAFDNAHKVLPRSKYDVQIDDESPRPGEQAFEKMSAGLYLGEIFRLVVKEMRDGGVILEKDGKSDAKIDKPYALDTGLLSKIENDESSDFSDTKALIEEFTGTRRHHKRLCSSKNWPTSSLCVGPGCALVVFLLFVRGRECKKDTLLPMGVSQISILISRGGGRQLLLKCWVWKGLTAKMARDAMVEFV